MIQYYLQESGVAGKLYLSNLPTSLDVDLPSRDIKLGRIFGNGGIVSGSGNYRGRSIKVNKIFEKNDEDSRNAWIEWFNKSIIKTLYFYKIINEGSTAAITTIADAGGGVVTVTANGHLLSNNDMVEITGTTNYNEVYAISGVTSNTFDITATWVSNQTGIWQEVYAGRIEVKGTPGGGENYSIKRMVLSNDVGFILISKDAFFQAIGITESSESITGTVLNQKTFTVNGVAQAVVYEFTASADFSLFQITTVEGYGFAATYNFLNGDVIVVNTQGNDLTMTVNGNFVSNVFSNVSTPFPLDNGENTLDIHATDGTLEVRYNEKRL